MQLTQFCTDFEFCLVLHCFTNLSEILRNWQEGKEELREEWKQRRLIYLFLIERECFECIILLYIVIILFYFRPSTRHHGFKPLITCIVYTEMPVTSLNRLSIWYGLKLLIISIACSLLVTSEDSRSSGQATRFVRSNKMAPDVAFTNIVNAKEKSIIQKIK